MANAGLRLHLPAASGTAHFGAYEPRPAHCVGSGAGRAGVPVVPAALFKGGHGRLKFWVSPPAPASKQGCRRVVFRLSAIFFPAGQQGEVPSRAGPQRSEHKATVHSQPFHQIARGDRGSFWSAASAAEVREVQKHIVKQKYTNTYRYIVVFLERLGARLAHRRIIRRRIVRHSWQPL